MNKCSNYELNRKFVKKYSSRKIEFYVKICKCENKNLNKICKSVSCNNLALIEKLA